jgi:hypothetical protein
LATTKGVTVGTVALLLSQLVPIVGDKTGRRNSWLDQRKRGGQRVGESELFAATDATSDIIMMKSDERGLKEGETG